MSSTEANKWRTGLVNNVQGRVVNYTHSVGLRRIEENGSCVKKHTMETEPKFGSS